jgi:hypothetical protein
VRSYGRVRGGGAPTPYDITNEYVELWADADFDAPGHGWPGPDWRLPIGEATAAHMIVTARTLGIGSPRDLILGGEGTSIGDYDVTFLRAWSREGLTRRRPDESGARDAPAIVVLPG